jgi:hypothetical protein
MADEALKVEMKRVVRCFQRYTHDQRADMMSSHRLGYLQREAKGQFFYVHPDVPGLAFDTRTQAAIAGLKAAAAKAKGPRP